MLYVYDAATGARLNTLDDARRVDVGPSIVDGTIYVGYGIGGPAGGVRRSGALTQEDA